ncbi:TonB-dependent receptor [Derxia gummosa]|uniref:TonB-dependent receptor n=1 Tax=Derxia gummosa DSM 723 TaxID=1121388 RepID=A0A8B6X5T7_9BURK|nr:TonB-dependent receptor [Derxia gummosa]
MSRRKPSLHKPASLRMRSQPANATFGGVALGLTAAMLVPLAAQAQSGESVMPAIKVEGKKIDPNPNAEVGVPYKAKTSGDVRHTRPLAETPQVITVITRDALDDSGQTQMTSILDSVPGITLGTGENGNAFGDRYIIRGQEARSDVFVDGLRDPGMTTRESFAIEQLEISKGPNSSFAGRGTAGGAINAITKQATLDYDFTRINTGFGSDDYMRITVDSNRVVTDDIAVRVNALWGEEDVPDRSPANRSRKGLALSGLYEISRDLSVTLDYYGLRAKDKPDLGSYMVGAGTRSRPAANTPVYTQAQDFIKSDVDTLTARVKWDIAPDTHLTSSTRYGETSNGYVTTGAVYRGTAVASDGSTYTPVQLDNHQGWQEVKYFAHQTNLRHDTVLAGMKHELIGSVEYTDHKVDKGNYSLGYTGATNCTLRNATTGATSGGYCIYDPSGNTVNGLNTLMGRTITKGAQTNAWHIRTLAASVMDTVDLTDRWTAFGGLRLDHFRWSLDVLNSGTNNGSYKYSDTLVNAHGGLTYKLTPKGIVYASVASAADINGGEADAGTNSGYGGVIISNGSVAGAKPEKSLNYELGTKWNLLDDKLLATAAVFETTKRDVMEGNGYATVGSFNSGKNRVKGVEFNVVGNVTDDLTASVGGVWMKSKVLESATATNVGRPLSNFADKSAFAQLKYRFVPDFSAGSTVRYESARCAGQPDTAAGYVLATGECSWLVPAYHVVDFFGSYRVNKNMDIRVNVLNAFNKDFYLAAYRSGSYVYKGDARAVRVTLSYEL